VWGGATFDTALRFLKEDPWERLAVIREAIPNTLLQMLLRGDNAVGYTNYPRWVITSFIGEAARTGIDVFRIFDCFNQLDKMSIALDAVKKHGALAELSLCYTGDIIDPRKTKYSLAYYVKVAKELANAGADILCIKDMAGLLKPQAARLLLRALRQEVDLPIHLHTHDTSGTGVAMLLAAAEEGCAIVDGAISSMSGLTSQPSLNALIASLSGQESQPTVGLAVVDYLTRYWEGVRKLYEIFDPGIRSTSTDVYEHEIPGGQFSNLYEQAKKVGLSSEEFFQLTMRYKEVNQVLGDLIKVTPSSKVVGDMALLLHKVGLSGERWLREKPHLDYPDSLKSFLKGHMGVPYGGFEPESRALVLGSEAGPAQNLSVDESEQQENVAAALASQLSREVSLQEVLSYRLYPKVFLDYLEHCRRFGKVTDNLPTDIFFHGLIQGRELEVDLEPGKTLIITLKGISGSDAQGKKIVFFQLNGFDREIQVVDRQLTVAAGHRPMADLSNPAHIPATMPGKVVDILVAKGVTVHKGQVLFITEAMKMEYTLTAKTDGVLHEVFVEKGEMVSSGELLATVK
jgi:pyruvate carboxylase